MLRVIRLTPVIAMMLVAVPAYAQIYKWVDERGVTNYSSNPPVKAGAKPVAIEDRISSYAPVPASERTSSANAAYRDRINASRIDALERQLAAERQFSQYAAAADAGTAQAAYEQCLAARQVDCSYDRGYYPYGVGRVVTVFQHRPPHVRTMARTRFAGEHIARVHAGGKLRRAGDLRR